MNTTTPEYLKLIEEFPLRRIKDRETNEAALKQLVTLTYRENELTEAELEYFAVLDDLIGAYEKNAVQAVEPMAPNAYLNHLMTEHNLRQVDICAQTGISKQNLSSFLSGSRKLSRDEIGRLATRFSVNPLAFVEEDHFGEIFKKYRQMTAGQTIHTKGGMTSRILGGETPMSLSSAFGSLAEAIASAEPSTAEDRDTIYVTGSE